MGIINTMLESRIDDNIIFTPINITTDIIDLLPDSIFNKDVKFLDIACKSGNFLKTIYNRLINSENMQEDFKNEQLRRQYILKHQLYGVAQSEFCESVAKRNIYGDINYDGNIKYIKNYMDLIKGNIEVYKKTIGKELNTDMKFDVIVGNPPYQSNTASIYQHFIDKAITLGGRIVNMY